MSEIKREREIEINGLITLLTVYVTVYSELVTITNSPHNKAT